MKALPRSAFFIAVRAGLSSVYCSMMRAHFLYILLLLAGSVMRVQAQKEFDFNPSCRQAYREIIQLKLASGQQLLDAEKQAHPDNLVPYFLENYIDFFILFFNEDPSEYRKREGNLSKRLEKMSEGPKTSPLYLFTKGIIHFQWAAVKIKFGNNWDAGWEFRRSFLQLKENQSDFPDFYPNELMRGAMQVAAGTIPDGYKWLSNLLGIKGTIKDGMKKIHTFLARTDEWSQLFHDEANFYYCYLKYYVENNKAGVFDYIRQQKFDTVNNHLFAYLAANLHLNSQRSENAKKIIESKNPSTAYLQTPVWDLEMGYAKLNKLEPDAATYLEKFIANFKGKSYVKDVLQKLSWYYYLQGNQPRAHQYRAAILKKGGQDTEADKQAMKEARTNSWPNKTLLQARLLNDGGYYWEALTLLLGKNYTDFPLPQERTEFAYRAARLYDDLGDDDKAITFYKQAIALGENRAEYFAARACLHLGNIYEKKRDRSTAISWYQRCLKMENHDFKNSLDQRAKAGIARCKEQ